VQKLFLKFNPLKFIYPIDNLAAFSTIYDEPDIYDQEFCQLIFDLLRYNILVNFLEYWQVDTIQEKCFLFDIKSYKKFSYGDKYEL